MVVVPTHVPGVEGVVAYHIQCLLRQRAAIAHQHLVQVLIVAKGQQYLIETTVQLVYPTLCAREREREREMGCASVKLASHQGQHAKEWLG